TTEKELEDQEDLLEDPKEAEQKPEDNDSNNIEKEELSEDSNEAEKEPENNNSRAS
ncbi:38454_t:CDS:2, partial [Gigaspora margarita]